MHEEFEKKLENYLNNNLPEDEMNDMEKELDKMEIYQTLIERKVENIKDRNFLSNRKMLRIIRIAKWKARFLNSFIVIGLLIAFIFICYLSTNLFYSFGSPSREEIYRNVSELAIAISKPNVTINYSEVNKTAFFTMKLSANFVKRVGNTQKKVGEMDQLIYFNNTTYLNQRMYTQTNQFYLPLQENPNAISSDWMKLQLLPEGTVAEAYIYFDRLYPTDEILQKLSDKNVEPIWFAVHTGDLNDKNNSIQPIGFTYHPIWLYENWETLKDGDIGTKKAPSLKPYDDAKLRNENFISTLKFLKKYNSITEKVVGKRLYLDKKINFVEKNGVKILGMVITGPTKEILKLKQETWIRGVTVGEIDWWNW